MKDYVKNALSENLFLDIGVKTKYDLKRVLDDNLSQRTQHDSTFMAKRNITKDEILLFENFLFFTGNKITIECYNCSPDRSFH